MKRLAFLLLALLSVFAYSVPAAHASTVTKVISCSPSKQLPDDPIIFPGMPGASHLHQFFGAKAVDAFSTPDSLVGTATTCTTAGDTAAYWVPTANVPEFHLGEYWDNRFTPTAIVPVPFGAELVIGNGRVAGDGKASVFWTCSNGVKSVAPLSCDANKLTLVIRFPNCWDGQPVDGDGLDNDQFAYSSGGPSPIQIGTGNVCPAGFPVKMAEVATHYRFTAPAGFTAVTFSSGAASTAHGDFLNSWVPAQQCTFLKSFTGATC